MLNFIYGALFAWFVISFIENETNILCGLVDFPMLVVHVLVEIAVSPFMLIYCIFFRHTIKPVSLEAIQKTKIMDDSKHLFGSMYICFDKQAKRLGNKIFLYKVKKSIKSIDKSSQL